MITTGRDGRILQWTSTAQSLLGYKSAQVLGRPLFEVLAARDVFGNRYCGRACGLVETIQHGELPRTFELEVETAQGGRMRVFVSVASPGKSSADRLIFQFRADLRRQTDRRQPSDRRRSAATERAGPPSPSPWRLSRREVDVLRRLAAGDDTRDIAAQLRISSATARNHAQSLLRKLGVHSRGEAIALAYRHKLV